MNYPTLITAWTCGILLLVQASHAALKFTLPALPYGYDALEPAIDKQTMVFHHDVHHAEYVAKLNMVLLGLRADKQPGPNVTLTDLVKAVGTGKLGVMLDIETMIRNNAGGHWNHAFYWRLLAPAGSANTSLPAGTSAFSKAVGTTFGGFTELIALMSKTGTAHFGSGWVYLVLTPAGKLTVLDTLNQDNPLSPVAAKGGPHIPILGLDVWEHSFYLHYGPNKTKAIENWWTVINWKQVELNYEAAKKKDFDTIIGYDANHRS